VPELLSVDQVRQLSTECSLHTGKKNVLGNEVYINNFKNLSGAVVTTRLLSNFIICIFLPGPQSFFQVTVLCFKNTELLMKKGEIMKHFLNIRTYLLDKGKRNVCES
jgi:hypothetical protein